MKPLATYRLDELDSDPVQVPQFPTNRMALALGGTILLIANAGTVRLQNFIWENDLNEYDATLRCQNLDANIFGNLRPGIDILGQEVLHRWAAKLEVAGIGCNILRDSWHYIKWFNSDSSVVGGRQGFRIADNGGGNFSWFAVEDNISHFDEYMMGFRLPANVAQGLFCVDDPVPQTATTFIGTRRNITMADIIDDNGDTVTVLD